MSSSPPKPWETAGGGGAAAAPATSMAAPMAASSMASEPPAVPARPSALAGAGAAYGAAGTAATGYGSTPYSRYGNTGTYGTGGYSSYSSGYGASGYGTSGYGASSYGTGMYGSSGYGSGGMYGSSGYGAGGMYGGGGMGMYGRPGFGGAMGPGAGGPNALQSSTQAAFDLLNSFVQSFGSFAGMLDSTLHATFQSFHAMMAVADQVGSLRATLGQVFSIMWLLRRLRSWIRGKVTGQPASDFAAEFTDRPPAGHPSHAAAPGSGRPPIKKKPIVIFIALVFGFPYLLSKLVTFLAARLAEQQQQKQKTIKFDPANIELVRALHDYVATTPEELSLKRGDVVAVLEKPVDPSGAVSPWWRGKLEKGPIGFFPSNYVEIIRKATAPAPVPAPAPPGAAAGGALGMDMMSEFGGAAGGGDMPF
ncbi:Peroxin 13, N-terminal region-domain-containing protein [Blastocladiella britannica]|nr:Peroxin 13, N-terminal region-domain-containing protein [Blastocladiella britannica]